MKKTLVIFVIFAVLMGGLVLLKDRARVNEEKAEQTVVASSRMKFDFEPFSVTTCTVRAGKETFELKKEEGQWKVVNRFGGINADAAVFLDFLTSLKNITTDERSNDPALFKSYALSDEEAIEVVIGTEKGTVEDLLLGFKATDKGSNFIRRKGSAKVYAVTEDILRYFGFGKDVVEKKFDLDKWLDKRVLNVAVDTIEGLNVTEGGKIYADVLKDATGAWQFQSAYAYPIDVEKVKNYIQMINGQRGVAIVGADAVKWAPEDWTLTLRRKDAAPIVLRRKYNDKGEFFIREGEKPYAIRVAVYHFSNLDRNDGGFFGDDLFHIDETKVSEVRFNVPGLKKKETLTLKAGAASWTTAKGVSFDAEKVKNLIQAVKSMRLATSPVAFRKSSEFLTISITSALPGRVEVKVLQPVQGANGVACYPVLIDKVAGNYCLEDSTVRQFSGAVEALYSK